MATGTVTTTASLDWTVRPDPFGPDPTILGGGIIQVNSAVNPSFPLLGPLQGFVWCHVDPVSIPTGAVVTQVDATITVQQSSSTSSSPGTHQSPAAFFGTESDVLAGGTPFPGFGRIGAGGVGDIPFDTAPHTLTFDDTYSAAFPPGMSTDPQGWFDALTAPDPLAMLVTAQVVADGEYLEYAPPWTFTIHWETTGTTPIPPLRLTNRDDMFTSARRLTGSRSQQGSNRLTGYL